MSSSSCIFRENISKGLKMVTDECGVFKLWKFKCAYGFIILSNKNNEMELIFHGSKYNSHPLPLNKQLLWSEWNL